MLHRSAGNGKMQMRIVAFLLWLAAVVAAQPARADAPLDFRDLQQRLTATAIENPGSTGSLPSILPLDASSVSTVASHSRWQAR